MTAGIDIHTHIVPENFPPYAGKGKDVSWPSMVPAHACHRRRENHFDERKAFPRAEMISGRTSLIDS